jgi:hypothetical protein
VSGMTGPSQVVHLMPPADLDQNRLWACSAGFQVPGVATHASFCFNIAGVPEYEAASLTCGSLWGVS